MSDGPTGRGSNCFPRPPSMEPSDAVTIQDTGTVGRYHPDGRQRWFGIASTGGVALLLGIAFLVVTSSVRYVEPAHSASLTTFDVTTLDQQPEPLPAPTPAESPARSQIERAVEKRAPIVPIPTAATLPIVATAQQQPVAQSPQPQASTPPSMQVARQPSPETEGPDSWEGRILTKLIANRRYPRAALLRRYQGIPVIRLVMDRNGAVQSVRLEKSSRIPDLDREALALPKRAQPLPKPPESREGASFEFVVPIEFSLAP